MQSHLEPDIALDQFILEFAVDCYTHLIHTPQANHHKRKASLIYSSIHTSGLLCLKASANLMISLILIFHKEMTDMICQST